MLIALAAPGGAAQAQSLAGTSWQGDQLQLAFTERGFTGARRCNRVAGSYRLSGNLVAFSGVISTRVFCPGPEIPLERARLARGRLELLDDSGAVVRRLSRASRR